MIFYLQRFVCAVFMTSLVACSAKYETYYEFDDTSKVNVQECVSYCKLTKEKCINQCVANGDLCQKAPNNSANLTKSDYVKDIQVNEDALPENSALTYDPLQCVSTQCDCDNDYRTCYQMCGGKVRKKERCMANCPDS